MHTESGIPAGFVPGIGSGDFVALMMSGGGQRRALFAASEGASGPQRSTSPGRIFDGLRRFRNELDAAGGAGGGLLNASYTAGGLGPVTPAQRSHAAAALPNLRFGRLGTGAYRDTPQHSGTVRGGTDLGRSGDAAAGPGTDAHTHYRSGGGKGLTEIGRQRVNSWMNFFMRSDAEGGMGLPRDKAAAMVGMMQGESGQNLSPSIFNPNDNGGPSGGTAQWHDKFGERNGRLTQLKRFAAARGKPWTDMETQQQFWKHEALTTHQSAWNAIVAARSAEGALKAGVNGFEVPADKEGEYRKRLPNVARIMRGDFDRAPQEPSYADETRHGLGSAAAQREAERAVLPRPRPDLLPRPQHREPAAAFGPRIEAMAHGIDFDHSGLDAAIAKVDTLHAKLRGLKATASVDINHKHTHKGENGERPGRLRTALNGGFASDGRAWT